MRPKEIGNNCSIDPETEFGSNVTIGHGCIIGENVVIEDEVVIHNYVIIYPGVTIHNGAEIFDHCVIGKPPTSPGSTARPIKDAHSSINIGTHSVICPNSVIYCGTQVGSHTLLGDFCSIREDCIIGDYCIISRNVSINYETTIGDHTKIMDNTHITGNMKIGNHVFISALVVTTNDNAMGRDGYDPEIIKGAVIEDYVTIGAGANILPAVTIGKNSIIGASALITKDVDPNSVMMGIPARCVSDVKDYI